MDQYLNTQVGGEVESIVIGQNTQGLEIRATVVRLARFVVVFEIYNPFAILRSSEVLSPFQIILKGKLVYKGKAVVSNLINTGSIIVCEASLDDGWLDVDFFSSHRDGKELRAEFEQYMAVSQKAFRIMPEFKLVVADMQAFLIDVRNWMEQIELGIRAQPSGDRFELERQILNNLLDSVMPRLALCFEQFEEVAGHIEPDWQPAHRAYVKKQLHPIVLCSPFMYRTFVKPLGYAGDYEMVNMMARDSYEGGSLFAKMLNHYFLNTPPVVAHRNRIKYLTDRLQAEVGRGERAGRIAHIYNLGCGPALEVQEFMRESKLAQHAQFTLLDFNEETVIHTGNVLNEIKKRFARTTPLQMVKKSVAQVVKESAKAGASGRQYDLVYCAGLFDYLPDQVCEKLAHIFYDMLRPGGLMILTNVEPSNPCRSWMEYAVDWNLIYRNHQRIAKLVPRQTPADASTVQSDMTGVNLFLEIRKPGHG